MRSSSNTTLPASWTSCVRPLKATTQPPSDVRPHIARSPLARAIILATETTLEAREISYADRAASPSVRCAPPISTAPWPPTTPSAGAIAVCSSSSTVPGRQCALRGRGGRGDRRHRRRHRLPGRPARRLGARHRRAARVLSARASGARLTETSIEWLRVRSVGTMQLLATDAGRPVYERLGFAAGGRYGSFAWPATGPRPRRRAHRDPCGRAS